MTKTTLITSFILAILLGSTACKSPPTGTENSQEHRSPATLRVGTYDSRGVALAYGRSKLPDGMLTKVARLRKEHEKASKAGDQERMAAVAAEAAALQGEIHRKVFSGAPIDDVLALIKKGLPHVARAAKVDLIAGDILFRRPGVEVVDLTLEMSEHFQPDAKTREMIQDLIKTKPVPESAITDHD